MHRIGALAMISAVGCLEFRLDPIDPELAPVRDVLVEESFLQNPLPRVDLLFVVDNTASMAQEQSALAADFGALATQLDAATIAWQVGAVTTSMEGGQVGWLQGSPWILTPDTPDRQAAFAAMVQPGAEGHAPEAGLAAAAEALALAGPGGPNAGFRRPDAVLHVVFVSDADDQSDPWLGADPVSSFLALLDDESVRTGLPGRASAVVGLPPSGCTSATGTAQAALRYAEVVEATGGVQVSICETDFGPLLEELGAASLTYQSRFVLREQPKPGSVRIEGDGDTIAGGWSLELEPPAIVFEVAPEPGSIFSVSYLVSNEG